MKKRKNFLPTLFLAVIFWGGWLYILLKIPPESNLLLVAFCLTLFLALFLTFALIFANTRRGLLLALFFVSLLLFGYFQIANILNLVLLAGIFLSLEIFFTRSKS